MTYGPKFDKDLRDGEAREDAFVHVLLKAKVEHKHDRKCEETGNLAIEYEQVCSDGQTRPSGIAITEADWYAIEFAPDTWVLIPIERLKHLTRRAIREKRARWIGDEDNHHNALVPFDWIRQEPGAVWSLASPALPPTKRKAVA